MTLSTRVDNWEKIDAEFSAAIRECDDLNNLYTASCQRVMRLAKLRLEALKELASDPGSPIGKAHREGAGERRMSELLDELRKVQRLGGDTYSSAEVIGLVGRAAAEIERLRAALTQLLERCEHRPINSRGEAMAPALNTMGWAERKALADARAALEPSAHRR